MRTATLTFALFVAALALRAEQPVPKGLALHLISTAVVSGTTQATLRLVNDSDRPFRYRGYSLERPNPNSGTEVWRHLRWRPSLLVGCGTGIETVTLPPGSSVIVELPVWDRERNGKSRRVRVTIWDADGVYAVRSSPFRAPVSTSSR